MKSVVLDGFAVNPGDLSWDFLGKYGSFTVFHSTTENETVSHIGDADIVLTNRAKITSEILDKCPNVKYVTALGTGYDMIDVSACRERNIEVCNVPAYSTSSVAQLAFTLLLALTTDLSGLKGIVKDGKWTGIPGFQYQKVPFTELAGKAVGIYGCGAIGKQFARQCLAFDMHVLAYRRSVCDTVIDGIEYVSAEKLLAESDYVSFHCPLTDQTRGMVNSDFISKMKKGAMIINTSRGAVINENDLANALTSGKLGGAGIDVMCKEPPDRDNPLLTAPNCIITPHCAWTSIEARRRLIGILDKNIESFVQNGTGINRVFCF